VEREAASPLPPSRYVRIFRGIGRALAVVVGLVAALLVFLHTSWGEEALRSRLQKRLGERFTSKVTLGGLRFSLRTGIDLLDLHIDGNDHKEAISAERIHLEPDYGATLGGELTLRRLAIETLKVHVVGKTDGTTNLTGIYQSKPIKRLVLKDIGFDHIAIDLTKPDGTKLAVHDLALNGSLDAKPTAKGANGKLELRVGEIDYSKAETRVDVKRLTTSVALGLEDGKGDVALGPTKATGMLSRPEKEPYPLELALPPVKVSLAEGELGVATEALQFAMLSLAALKVETHRKDGELAGNQVLAADRLVVNADALSALAGKRVLAGDVSLDVHAKGPETALVLDSKLATPGGELTAAGNVNVKEKRFDLTLSGKDVDSTKIVALDTVPPVAVRELTLKASGSGFDRASLSAAFSLHASGLEVRGKRIDAADIKGKFEGGKLTIESLQLDAFGQRATGDIAYSPEDKRLRAHLVAQGPLQDTLKQLRAAGVVVPASPVVASLSANKPLEVDVSGQTDGRLDVDVRQLDLGVAGGRVSGSAHVELVAGDPNRGEKRFRAERVDADLALGGFSLATLGKLRGKPLPLDGTLTGRARVYGSLAAPSADIDLHGDLAGGAGKLVVTAKAAQGQVDAKVRLAGNGDTTLLEGQAKLRVANKALDPMAPLAVHVEMPKQDTRGLKALLHPEVAAKIPSGDLALKADVSGTLARPDGRVLLTSDGLALSALPGQALTFKLDTHISPANTMYHADVALAGEVGWRAGAADVSGAAPLHVDLKTTVPTVSARTKKGPLPLDVHLTLAETSLADLPLAAEKKAGLAGRVALDVRVRGTSQDLNANVSVHGKDLAKNGKGHADVDLQVALGDDATTIDGKIAALGHTWLLVRGDVKVGGRGLAKQVAAARERALALQLEVPAAPLGALAPGLGAYGQLRGLISVGGVVKAPELSGDLSAGPYTTLSGKMHHTRIGLKGGLEALDLSAAVSDAVLLSAHVSPQRFLDAKNATDTTGGAAPQHVDAQVPVEVRLSTREGASIPLAEVVPALPALVPLGLSGTLRSDLTARLALHVTPEGRSLKSLDLTGPLALTDVRARIPQSSRVIDAGALRLRGEGERLTIESLEAHEHDREKADRTLRGSGSISLRDRTADLQLALQDVLVFGAVFGQADAPRASLTGKVGVRADLSGATRKVDVFVHALELNNPDRFARAHQQEVLSLGDVIELGDGPNRIASIGKLPAPAAPAASSATSPAEPAAPSGADKPRGEPTLVVHVRIPNTIHLKQKPLDLYAKGDVLIERYGEDRVLSGSLVCERGDLLVGGLLHTLTRGEVRLGADGAVLDLHFQRTPAVAGLRDFATDSGTAVFAHMVGPFGKQKLTFSGVSDGLFETLAINNGGRVRVLSSPEAPASQTAQLPQQRELRQTAYMGANLPHLAFLTRMNTFADPSTSRVAYGRFQNLEAERYSEDGSQRLRTTVRPPVVGQSEAEVEYDLLFQNTPRVVSGVGVFGGTRAGGGPALFWEWSSKD
jgi:hypothetical protein